MQHTGLVLSLEKQALQAIRAELMLRHQQDSSDSNPDVGELTHVHFDDFAVVLLRHMFQLPLESKLDQPFYTNTNAFHLQMASIISVFDAVDVDCRGVIDFNDFTNFCLRLGRLLFKPSIRRSSSTFLQFQPQSNTNLPSTKMRYLPEFRLLFVSDSDAPRVRLYNKEGKLISRAFPVFEARKLHRAKFHKTLTYYEKATHEKDLYQYRLTEKELDPNKGAILDVVYVEAEKQLVFSCSSSYLIFTDAKKNIFDVNGNLKVENYMRTKHPLYGLHYCRPLEMIIGFPGEGSSHVFEVIDPNTRTLKFEVDKHNTKILAICEVVLDKARPLKNHYFVSSSIDKKLLMWSSAPLSTLLNKNPIRRMLRVADTIDFELRGHEHAIQSIAFAPVQELIFGCGFDFEIFAWDPFTRDLIMRFVGHFKSIVGILIVNSPNEKLVSLDDSGVLKMWSINKDLGVYGEQEASLGLNIQQPAHIRDFAKVDDDGRALGVLTDQISLVRIEGDTLDDLKPVTSGLGICPISGRMFVFYRSAIQVIDILSASHVKRVAFLDPDRVSSTDMLVNRGDELRMNTVVMSSEERQQQQRHLKQVGYIDMRDTVSAVAYDERGKKVFIGTSDGRVLLFDSFTFGLMKQLTSEEEDTAFKQQGGVLQLIYVDRDELLIALYANGAVKIFGGCHRGGYQSSDHHHQPVNSGNPAAKRNKRRRSSVTPAGVPQFEIDESTDFNFPRANGGKPPSVPLLLRECDLGVVLDQSIVGMDLSLAQNIVSVLTKSGMVYNFDYTNLDFVNCIQIEDSPNLHDLGTKAPQEPSTPMSGLGKVQTKTHNSFFVTESKEKDSSAAVLGEDADVMSTEDVDPEREAKISAATARANAFSTTNRTADVASTHYVAIQYIPMVPIMLVFSNTNVVTAWCIKSMDYKYLYSWNLFDVTHNVMASQFYEKFLWPGLSHEETHSRFKPHVAATISTVKLYIIHSDAMLTGVTSEAQGAEKGDKEGGKSRHSAGRTSFSSASNSQNPHLPFGISSIHSHSKKNSQSHSKFEWILIIGNEDGQVITQDISLMVTKAGAVEHMKRHEAAGSVYQKFKPKRFRMNDLNDYTTTYHRFAMPELWLEKLQNPLKREAVMKLLLTKQQQMQREKEAIQEAAENFMQGLPHSNAGGSYSAQHADDSSVPISGGPRTRNGPLRISALGRKTLRLAQRQNKIKSIHLNLEGHVEEYITGLYAWNAYQMGNIRSIMFYHPYLNYQSDHNHTTYEAFEIQPHKHKLPLLVTMSDLGIIRMWTFCGTCIGEHIDEKSGKQDDVNAVAEALRAADGTGGDQLQEEEEEEEDDETRRRKESEEARKKQLHLEPPSTTFVTTLLADDREGRDGFEMITNQRDKRRTPLEAMATLSSKIFVMDKRKALTIRRFQVTMKQNPSSTAQPSTGVSAVHGNANSRNPSIPKQPTPGMTNDTGEIIARAASVAAALANSSGGPNQVDFASAGMNMSFATMINNMNQNLAAQYGYVRHIISVVRPDPTIDAQNLVRRPLGAKGWFLPSVAIYMPTMLNAKDSSEAQGGDVLPMESPMHFTLVQYYYFRSILNWALPLIGTEVNHLFARRMREALGMTAIESAVTPLAVMSTSAEGAINHFTLDRSNNPTPALSTVIVSPEKVSFQQANGLKSGTDNKQRPQSASAVGMRRSKSSHSLQRRPSMSEDEIRQKKVKDRSAKALASADGDKGGNLAQILDTMTEKELEVASYLQQQNEKKFAKASMSNLIDYIQDSQYFDRQVKQSNSKSFFFENFENEKVRRIRTPSRASAEYEKLEADIRTMIAAEDELRRSKRLSSSRPSSAPATRGRGTHVLSPFPDSPVSLSLQVPAMDSSAVLLTMDSIAMGVLSPPIVSVPSQVGLCPEPNALVEAASIVITSPIAGEVPGATKGKRLTISPPRSQTVHDAADHCVGMLTLSPCSAMFESAQVKNIPPSITIPPSPIAVVVSAPPTRNMKRIDSLIEKLEDVSITVYDADGAPHKSSSKPKDGVSSPAEFRPETPAGMSQTSSMAPASPFRPIASVQDLLLHRSSSGVPPTNNNTKSPAARAPRIKPVLGQASMANTFSNLPRLQEISQHYNDVVLAAKLESQGFDYYDPARKRKEEERIKQKNRLQRKLVAAKDRDAYVEDEKFDDFHDIDREARKLQARKILQQAQAMGDKSSFGYYKSDDLIGFLHFLDLLTPIALENLHVDKQILLFYYDDQGNDYSKFVKDQPFYEIDEILAYVTEFLEPEHLLPPQLVFFRDEAPNLPYIPLFHLIGFVFSLSKSKPLQLKLFMFITAAQRIYDLLRSAQMPKELQAIVAARRSQVAAEREARDKGLLPPTTASTHASLSTSLSTSLLSSSYVPGGHGTGHGTNQQLRRPQSASSLSRVASRSSTLSRRQSSDLSASTSVPKIRTGGVEDMIGSGVDSDDDNDSDDDETPSNTNQDPKRGGAPSSRSQTSFTAASSFRNVQGTSNSNVNNNNNVNSFNNNNNKSSLSLQRKASSMTPTTILRSSKSLPVGIAGGSATAAASMGNGERTLTKATSKVRFDESPPAPDGAKAASAPPPLVVDAANDDVDEEDEDELYDDDVLLDAPPPGRFPSHNDMNRKSSQAALTGLPSGNSASSNKEVAKQRASRLHVQLIEMIRSDRAVNKALGEDGVNILQQQHQSTENTEDNGHHNPAGDGVGGAADMVSSQSVPATPVQGTGAGVAGDDGFAAPQASSKRPSSAPASGGRGGIILGNRRSTLLQRGKHRHQVVYEDEEEALENEQQRQEKLQYKADVLMLKRVYLVTNPTRFVVKPNLTRGFRQWIIRRRAFSKVSKMLNMWCDDNFECLNVQDFVDIFNGIVPKQEKDNYRIMRSLTMSLSRMGLRLINELSGEVLQKIFEGILEVKIISG